MKNALRTTAGRGRLYDSIVDTVGDTPCVRINRLAPTHVRVFAKLEFFNPAGPLDPEYRQNVCRAAEVRALSIMRGP